LHFPISLTPYAIRYISFYPLFSTTVERALQIHPFLTNKANFQKSQMNVNDFITMNYGKIDTWSSGKKQSQTNPKKAKFKKAKMNVTKVLTKEYGNISPILTPKKQTQFSKRQKSIQLSLPQRVMEVNHPDGHKKTNPIKANSTLIKGVERRYF